MQTHNVKLALAIIVKPGEGKYLLRALQYTSKYVDGVFVTITGDDKEEEAICKGYNAVVSHYKWDNHFANARNFNFSQVTKDFTHILWMDVDDLFKDNTRVDSENLSNLKSTIQANWDVDGFLMNYCYWFDQWKNPVIVHLKTQIVKNDNCVEWAGRLHEDFKPRRQLNVKLLKEFDRLHITDDRRVENATKRNLEISEIEFKQNPEDPRSYWNLANSQKAMGLPEDALKNYDEFLKSSESDDEKYIAMLRMAEIYTSMKMYRKALDTVKYAIGTKPEYPDAYLMAGNLYSELQDYYKARDSYLLGMKMKPPKYDIVIYNPRDYDYYPLKNLAYTYIELMLPSLAYECLKACIKICPGDQQVKLLLKAVQKEQRRFNKILKEVERLQKIKDKDELKRELDLLPEEYQSHPSVCKIRNINFIKKTSSGQDITIFTSHTPEMWNPELVKEKGIGGSEEAVINLAKKWKEKGYNVDVYAHSGREIKVYDGVRYLPWWMFNAADRTDILVLWRTPMILDHELNAKKVYVDLHDVFDEGEFMPHRLAKIDKIFVKSHAHRELYPSIPDDKFIIVPNGIDMTLFDKHKDVKRDPYLLINLSSPDRSLNGLLDIYKEVLLRLDPKLRKKVTLAWYYGWDLFDRLRTKPKDVDWKMMVMKKWNELGTMIEGGMRINHEDVAKLNLEAGALIYPSQFYEIDWVGGSKAQLAGCLPITTNYAAIGEKVKYGIKIDVKHLPPKVGTDLSVQDEKVKEQFVSAIIDYLNNPGQFEMQREQMMAWARKEFDLDRIANVWIDEFKKVNIIKPQVARIIT